MKLSFAPLIVLVFTLFTCICASPTPNKEFVTEESLINSHDLVERHVKFPVKANNALIAKIMVDVKADLHAKVFAAVTATFCERAAASLDISANILGGLVKVGKIHLKAIESAALKNVKGNFEASLNAEVKAKIYGTLDARLRKSCGTKLLDKVALLRILTDLEAQAKALIKVQLPKIGASLKVKAKSEVEAAIKGVEVDIPLIAKVTIDAKLNAKATLDACVAAGLKMCAKLDAKAAAKAILSKL